MEQRGGEFFSVITVKYRRVQCYIISYTASVYRGAVQYQTISIILHLLYRVVCSRFVV